MTTTAVMNPKDFMLIERIKSGPAPFSTDWQYYMPAKSRGVHLMDQAFVMRDWTIGENFRVCFIADIARQLVREPLPDRQTWQGTSPYTTKRFYDWLKANRPELFERALHIVNLGLRPWEEAGEREAEKQLEAARSAFTYWNNRKGM